MRRKRFPAEPADPLERPVHFSRRALLSLFPAATVPRASMSILRVRSPFAMAVVTVAICRTCPVRL
ncbi:hypothetical protein, partial [Streptomyces zhihengii]|uniref:hypothetical protein n=1 Tax=Streptomyces zhihengii TaxID=1818004 RepID=UPI0033A1EC10